MKILCILLLLVSFAAGQYPIQIEGTEIEKKKKELEAKVQEILDQSVADAQSLKLAQNRAIVYAIAGDLYWKFDEKRAREIFHNCENEIIAANAEFERETKASDDPMSRVFEVSTLRNDVLPLVAKHDASLALEMLIQTRSATLADAMARLALPNKSEVDAQSFSPERQAVRMELDLEQRFAVLAADSDPDKAIALIKDSLSRGISWNVMPLLEKLNRKDEKKASDLAGDVIRKIVDTDLTRRTDDLNAAISFLLFGARASTTNVSSKEKPFRFSETQLKDLANKLASTFLSPSKSTNLLSAISRSMPALERIVPEKVALLKLKQTELSKSAPSEYKRMQERQKLWDTSTTPEQILAMLPKLNDVDRAFAYQALPGRIATIDDDVRAKKLIDQIPDEKTRQRAADQYESTKINRAARDGRFDDARRSIGNISDRKTQVQRLVALAMQFQIKGGEKNKETAAGLMKDARALINEFPEDEDELVGLLEVVKGYSQVDPNEGFRLFEPIFDQINEVVQAMAVLSKYSKRNRSFKSGELVLKINGYGGDGVILFRCISQMQMLGKADLDRMSQLADRLQRPDSRIISKLFIAQGFLNPARTAAPEMASGMGMPLN
jgi:hypothetical protein